MTTAGSNFVDEYNANLVGLWDFLSGNPGADNGLDDGVAQNGAFRNGATAQGDQLVTSGNCDQHFLVRDPSGGFDLSQGTIITRFSQDTMCGHKPDTLISRGDYAERQCDGFLDIRVTSAGAVEVLHTSNGAQAQVSTTDGFFSAHDDVEVFYSWSDTGGALKVVNHTTGDQEQIDISQSLTLDIGDANDGFVVGARAQTDHNIDHEFDGTIDYVAVYDDDVVTGGGLNGIVEGTQGDDVIDLAYTGDPEGDRIDNSDNIFPGRGPEDDFVEAFGGDDIVRSGDGKDNVRGGTGDDTLFGEADSDTLYGGAGNDILSGDNNVAGDKGDELYGETGNDTFINIGETEVIDGGEDANGQDIDVLDLTGAGETVNPGGGFVRVVYDPNDTEAGTVHFFDAAGNQTGTTTFQNIEKVIGDQICFTPGTVIATPKGERAVETLVPGDRVITRDNGIQEIRWAGRNDLSGGDLASAPHLRPICIRAGSLGDGLPERDMYLSPNHRVLIANEMTSLYFEEPEVLIAAKHLTDLPGIGVASLPQTSYIHLLFDNHEVILSDGAWTESFQPGDYSMAGLGNAQRAEIFELFPELETEPGMQAYGAARRALKRYEAQALFN